jgi:hypothetical protein
MQHGSDLVQTMMTQRSGGSLLGRCDHQLAGILLVPAGQNGRFDRLGAQRLERFVEDQHAARGKFATARYEIHGEVTIAVRSNLRGDCIDFGASLNPDSAAYRVPC